MRKPAILAVLAVAALAAAWWLLRDGGAPQVELRPAGSAPDAARGESAPARANPLALAERAQDGGAGGGAPGGVAAPERELRGTFVAVDERGAEQRALDGRFELHFKRGDGFEQRTIEVKGGRWRSGVEPPAAIGVDGVVLGERIGRTDYEPIVVPASGELELRTTLVPPSILRVVDARTRAVLDGVDVAVDSIFNPGGRLHPEPPIPDKEPIVRAARSPVTLPPIDGQPVLWVHVAGYAWARVQVLGTVGGEREVALERGGALVVTIAGRGRRSPSETELHLRRGGEDGDLDWRAPLDADRFELGDFAPGPVDVEVRVESGADPIATARAEVRAGETARVELTLPDVSTAPETVLVALGGRIVGAAADLAAARAAWLLPAEARPGERGPTPPKRVELRQPAFHFDGLRPGRYLVTIEPLQVHALFDVGPEGIADAVIELPTLADVEVEVVDGRTGEWIADGNVAWRTIDHPLPDRNYPERAQPDPTARVGRFRAPPGAIQIHAWPEGYDVGELDLDVRPGPNRATIKVEREQYVRLLLKEGSATVPADPGTMEFLLLRADGTAAQTGWAREPETGALNLAVAAPGDYLLKSPRLSGYAPIADRPVHVEYGGTTDVVIELVKE